MMLAMGPRKVARYLSMRPRASCSFSFLWRLTSELEDVSGAGAGLLEAESLDTAGVMAGNCIVGEANGSGLESRSRTEAVSRTTHCNFARMSAACWKSRLR